MNKGLQPLVMCRQRFLTVRLTLQLIELRLPLHRILHTNYCLLNTRRNMACREPSFSVSILDANKNPFCPSDIFPLARGKLVFKRPSLILSTILHTNYCLLNTRKHMACREPSFSVSILDANKNPFCPSDIFPLARGKLVFKRPSLILSTILHTNYCLLNTRKHIACHEPSFVAIIRITIYFFPNSRKIHKF